MNRDCLEEKYAAIAAEEIRKEIDWEVISVILIDQGWTPIKFPARVSTDTANEMYSWCKYTLSGKFRHTNYMFLFESEKDAAWFALRWVNG